MSKRTRSTNCAYCGEPLPIVDGRIQSWRVRDKYTCNEFCADGIEDCPPPKRRVSSTLPGPRGSGSPDPTMQPARCPAGHDYRAASRSMAALFSRQ